MLLLRIIDHADGDKRTFGIRKIGLAIGQKDAFARTKSDCIDRLLKRPLLNKKCKNSILIGHDCRQVDKQFESDDKSDQRLIGKRN
jgi:hypothetical protein